MRSVARGPCRRALTLLAWSASAISAGVARADQQTVVALEYEVAPEAVGCPDAEEFRASVERQLGYDPFRPAADKRVAVQIARGENHFDGRIRWSDARGRWVGDRRLSSRRPDCDEIATSLAFSVAVQVQLLATLAPAPEAAAPPPLAPPPPPASPAPRVPDAAATPAEGPVTVTAPSPGAEPAPRGTRLELAIGLGPSLALGVAPQTTGLGRLFVSGRLSWLSLELALDAAWPATERESDGSGFSLDRFAGTAGACGHAGAFAGCLTATLGVLEARGFGVDVSASPAGLFSQVGARIVATRELGGRYFLAARVDGLLMLSPWKVTLNDTTAWMTPRVGALIGLDLGARFF
jgi:hypothetical protein